MLPAHPRALAPLLCALLCFLGALSPASASAEGKLRNQLRLAARYEPIGLALFHNIGWRTDLFESDSLLLKDTYLEAGASSILSPAYIRTGAYVEAVPVALLQLRSTVHYSYFWGAFGLLYEPEDPDNPAWELADLEASADNGLGVRAHGLMVENRIIPRLKVGRLVVLSELRHVYIRMGLDQVYYEPLYDQLLEPSDHIWTYKPTLGGVAYQGEESFLLTGLRWERTWTQNTELRSDLVAILLLWGLPSSWIKTGSPRLALLGGTWLRHPTDREYRPWVGGSFEMNFGL